MLPPNIPAQEVVAECAEGNRANSEGQLSSGQRHRLLPINSEDDGESNHSFCYEWRSLQ
jgi:hypothetical protein